MAWLLRPPVALLLLLIVSIMRRIGAFFLFYSCTLVFLWLVLIGSKDLNGGEASDAVLTTQ